MSLQVSCAICAFCVLIVALHSELSAAGQPVNLGVQPSNCVITKLKIDKDRKAILDRKNRVADSA